MGKNLKNIPLIEAIFEIRWVPPPSPNNPFTRDPFFHIHAGQLLPLLVESFPEVDSLLPPSVPLPEEVLQKMFHYRLFSEKKQMPLVQLGPGMLTFNADDSYRWQLFQERLQFVLKQLYDSRPNPQKFSLEYLSLKYLNFFEYDDDKDQAIDFLRDKLKLGVSLPVDLFKPPICVRNPISFNFFWQFPCCDGSGTHIGSVILSINVGEKKGKKGIFMEIGVQGQKQFSKYSGDKISAFPVTNVGVLEWVVSAHDIIKYCFSTITEEIKNELDL
ncbi:MAG: TIGR04255 family protein [Planctomycetaceae bacterium]|jgi:uncharacterized protein (TIGR04255 family)|nr:TIGR04255 family protein [Planctomycetaceae bacterium]